MSPNLPEKTVNKAFVSQIMPAEVQKELNVLGVECVFPKPAVNIRNELRFHPDILMCNVDDGIWYAEKSNEQTFDFGELKHLKNDLGEKYPEDCLLNHAVAGGTVICGKHADVSLFGAKSVITVNQGYAKCSTVVVAEDAFITSDSGICKALRARHLDVLQVSDDMIGLNGYDHGFIGGCAGKVSKTLLVFTGRIESHPEYAAIKNFCGNRGVDIYSLGNNFLYDLGGVLPIC